MKPMQLRTSSSDEAITNTRADIAEILCRRCWWREGDACYNEGLMGPGKVNKIPRKAEGDDRNGMEITDEMWRACKVTAKAMNPPRKA